MVAAIPSREIADCTHHHVNIALISKTYPEFRLTIKGRPGDDAVLCTPTSTFLLRTVSISNSLIVCRAPTTSHTTPTLEIRDTCHEVLECLPQAANLGRIRTVLKNSQWEGMAGTKRKRGEGGKKWTRAQLESVVQASEAELAIGLRERDVVEMDGEF